MASDRLLAEVAKALRELADLLDPALSGPDDTLGVGEDVVVVVRPEE